MRHCDRFSGVSVVLPGMGQATVLASNVQPRPTCFRKGWTAVTRMESRFVQPPNLLHEFFSRTCTCVRVRVRARCDKSHDLVGKVGMLDRASNDAACRRPTFCPTSGQVGNKPNQMPRGGWRAMDKLQRGNHGQ